MNLTGVPIIITFCYIVGEIYKKMFNKKKKLYKLIPIFMIILGGFMGVLLYFADPTMILESNNIYKAIVIGITSGATSTCTNQVVKQLNKQN